MLRGDYLSSLQPSRVGLLCCTYAYAALRHSLVFARPMAKWWGSILKSLSLLGIVLMIRYEACVRRYAVALFRRKSGRGTNKVVGSRALSFRPESFIRGLN